MPHDLQATTTLTLANIHLPVLKKLSPSALLLLLTNVPTSPTGASVWMSSLQVILSTFFFQSRLLILHFAAGLNIVSAYIGSPRASATLSGTSMASPHTAGMLAYLLSLYPSKVFNPRPRPGGLVPLPMLDQQRPLTTRVASLYSFAREVLPSWMSDFLPSPEALEGDMAPVPVPTPPTLTPEELKRALIALATPDVLEDLPNQTPNLLIFNNATDEA